MPKPAVKETSSVQTELPARLASLVCALGKQIPAEHLAGDGLDLDVPHITLRYGLESDDAEPLRKIVTKHLPFFVKLGKTKTFEPGEDGSVPLYVEVVGPAVQLLAQTRKAVEAAYECRPDDHPHYNPHVTVAFLAPEHAHKYVQQDSLAGKEWIVSSLTLSDRNRCKTDIGK
jgi:2'-5' RNA ligase